MGRQQERGSMVPVSDCGVCPTQRDRSESKMVGFSVNKTGYSGQWDLSGAEKRSYWRSTLMSHQPPVMIWSCYSLKKNNNYLSWLHHKSRGFGMTCFDGSLHLKVEQKKECTSQLSVIKKCLRQIILWRKEVYCASWFQRCNVKGLYLVMTLLLAES